MYCKLGLASLWRGFKDAPFFPSRYKGCPGQHWAGMQEHPELPPRRCSCPTAKSSEMKKLTAQKGEKNLASLKTRALSPHSVPALALKNIPTLPGEQAPLRNKSTSLGVWRRQAPTSQEKSFRPWQKAEQNDGKKRRQHPDKLLWFLKRNRLSTSSQQLSGTQKWNKKLCHDWEEK